VRPVEKVENLKRADAPRKRGVQASVGNTLRGKRRARGNAREQVAASPRGEGDGETSIPDTTPESPGEEKPKRVSAS